MSWRTFDEWNEEGPKVRKGERSQLRCPITRDALFHDTQVEDIPDGIDEGDLCL